LARAFSWVICYFIIRSISVTNRADMNRKDFVMEVQEAGFIFLLMWIVLAIMGLCIKNCCFRNATPQAMTPIGDIILTFLLVLWPYVCYWVISKYWEGYYINNDLTPGQAEART